MDLNKLNHLLEKARSIDAHEITIRKREELEICLREIKLHYGSFLLEKLFDIYDSHFSENPMMALESYISPRGVEIDGPFGSNRKVRLCLKPYPVRFELEAPTKELQSVIWSAA